MEIEKENKPTTFFANCCEQTYQNFNFFPRIFFSLLLYFRNGTIRARWNNHPEKDHAFSVKPPT